MVALDIQPGRSDKRAARDIRGGTWRHVKVAVRRSSFEHLNADEIQANADKEYRRFS